MNIDYSLEDLNTIAKKIIASAKHKILLFYGEMGAGKTTLIKEICKELNIEDVSHSPTFSLVNEYKTADNNTVYHFDLYRIEDEEEAYNIGIEDYLYSNNWCLIEWAENIENLLPQETTSIYITKLDETNRNIKLENS
ncbi:MAG: tRNA (adenosine(37)-N6)-threonylcarbamoyltransferase complex ATPase subunit type 1 TsaE [Tenacibaculum sp.]|nr:tRNA (adenosine(37)-N6)-threonylcarbamoyltransferase complex ATPase subunit type 1 TsaE [Tenacibaculum sp.]